MDFDFSQIGPPALAACWAGRRRELRWLCGVRHERVPWKSKRVEPASVRLWPANCENALKRAPAQLAERDEHRISDKQ